MKALVYRKDHINTDEIIPARYLNTDNEQELAIHAMEVIDDKFIEKVQKNDVIISGKDFGCGSSREHAIWAIKGAGISAVIAKSFARIFFRNAINNGMLVIEADLIDKISNNDQLEIDIDNGLIKNITKNEEYDIPPIPKFVQDMINAGGLLNIIEKEAKK